MSTYAHTVVFQLGAKTKTVIEETFNSSANEVEEYEEPCSACGGGLASYRDEAGPAWGELQSSTLKFGWDDKASTRDLLLKLLNIDASLAAVSRIALTYKTL